MKHWKQYFPVNIAYLFNKFMGIPICMDFYLNHHHTTAHKQRDASVALASNFKGKIHSQRNIFGKCMTEMFALNYDLRVSAGP